MIRSSLFWMSAVAVLLRRRRDFVQQSSGTDCGVACALTVLNFLGRPANPVQAVDLMDPDKTGTNMDALRRYFEDHHGVPARALSVPADRLREIKGHAILHMTQLHYVVLLKASRQGVLVFDPSMGPVYYPAADFAALYSGHLVDIARRPARRSNLPAQQDGTAAVLGANLPAGIAPLSLFVIGAATRLLELALILCLCAVLYLVLNRASFASLLLAFGVIAVCGGLLLLARQIRFEGEDGLIRRKQSTLWRGLLRTAFRGRDISGFRGRFERDVAGALRRGMIVTIPQKAQLPATFGAFATMSAALCMLHPLLGVAHLALFGYTLIMVQLDGLQVCRRSVRGTVGRYTKLSLGNDVMAAIGAPDMIGETAKWGVIGVAGVTALLANLPDMALMFWILTAMQIVPTDFRRAPGMAPALAAREPVSGLMATEVPLRRQKVIGDVALKLTRGKGLLRIEGLTPLTASLQQPDLTVREQRLIMAEVVRNAVRNLPEDDRPQIGPIRIFGPGQEATQADFEHLVLARETASGNTLPVPKRQRKDREELMQDPVLRALLCCDPGDFPVFWDVRGRMDPAMLREKVAETGLGRAGHLTMTRLTLIEAA